MQDGFITWQDRLSAKIADLINKFRKTECKNCKYNGGGCCLNSFDKYAECCGWYNKNFKSKE